MLRDSVNQGKVQMMKHDTAVIPLVVWSVFTQLGTSVPFVMKESDFTAVNGWEDS